MNIHIILDLSMLCWVLDNLLLLASLILLRNVPHAEMLHFLTMDTHFELMSGRWWILLRNQNRVKLLRYNRFRAY